MRAWMLLIAVAALLLLAAPAQASSVTGVTVQNDVPSRAAGARTQYVVALTPTTALSQAAGDHITVTFPAGAGFAALNGASVFDGGSNVQIGSCGSPSGQTFSCSLFSGTTIAAGHAVQVRFNGVTNPGSAGSYVATVSTTQDTTAANSSPFTVVAAQPVTGVSVDNTAASRAAGARTQYAVSFTTSTTGGLAQAGNSRITVTFPNGASGLNSLTGTAVFDTTATGSPQVGGCGTVTGQSIDCFLFSGESVPAGHAVRIAFNGVVNPSPAGSYQASVSTTSDPATIFSPNFGVVAQQPVTGVSVDNTAASTAAGARTQYAVSFTTSSSGGLAQAGNSRIAVTFPNGASGLNSLTGTAVFDTTAAGSPQVGGCGTVTGQSIDCFLFSGQGVPAGHTVRITFNGVVNPSTAGSYQATVATTSDLATVASASFSVDVPQAVTGVTVDDTAASNAAGARTQYAVAFNTSSTGGLAQAANSRITVTLPNGTTGLDSLTGTAVFDTTASGSPQVGGCGTVTGQSIDCFLFSGETVPAGHRVQVKLNGVENPSPAGSYQASVSTTSDTATVQSASFGVVAQQAVSGVSVDNTVGSAAASARAQYAVSFTTSTTGGLAQVANSRITVTFPSDTSGLNALNGTRVFDTTASGSPQVGGCGTVTGLSIDCFLFSGQAIPAGHHVRIEFNGLVNPSTAGSYTASVSTTSDPPTVGSSPFSVVASHAVASLAVGLGSSSQSAKTTYTVDLTTSSTGGLHQFANSRITLTFPSGTDLSALTGTKVESPAGTQVGGCGTPTGLAVDCFLFNSLAIAPNTGARVIINGVGNPSAANTYSLQAKTTSDTQTSATYGVGVDTTPPAATIDSGPSGTTTDSTPTFAFSSNEAGSTFACSVDGGSFATCTSPFTPSAPLAAGPHTFDVRATDPANNQGSPVRRSFTVAAATPTPTATPTATPTPTPTPTPAPTPTFHKSVVVSPVSGTVLIRRPGGNGFVQLDASKGIPLGSTVDVTKGVLQLSARPKPGAPPQTAEFYGGVAKVTQPGGVTQMTLNEKLASCGGKASASRRRARRRRLWGDGHGSFRTRGQYSAATVRGTKWLVQDSCAGTLTKVARGVVSVRDLVKKKTVRVPAGHSYLARPRRP